MPTYARCRRDGKDDRVAVKTIAQHLLHQRRLGWRFGEFNMDADLVLTDDAGRSSLVDSKHKLFDFLVPSISGVYSGCRTVAAHIVLSISRLMGTYDPLAAITIRESLAPEK